MKVIFCSLFCRMSCLLLQRRCLFMGRYKHQTCFCAQGKNHFNNINTTSIMHYKKKLVSYIILFLVTQVHKFEVKIKNIFFCMFIYFYNDNTTITYNNNYYLLLLLLFLCIVCRFAEQAFSVSGLFDPDAAAVRVFSHRVSLYLSVSKLWIYHCFQFI